jgi:dihydrofolate reductase
VVGAMTRLIVGMTTSIDGFVADEHGSVERLYPDLAELQDKPYMKELIAATGAVIMGRRTYEMPDDPDVLADGYEFQVPIFVVTHHPPAKHPKENGRISFTFVTEGVRRAAELAIAAAKDRDVTVVGGADIVAQLFEEMLVDELHIDVMPVFLGGGLRFWNRRLDHVRLQTIDVSRTGERISLKYRVLR